MEELYKEYQNMLSQMRGAGFYEAIEWHCEISKFKEKHGIDAVHQGVMRMKDGTEYRPI